MKLIRFSLGDAKPSFGVVIGEHAIAFTSLQQHSGSTRIDLSDSNAYLVGLPESERAARDLLAWGKGHLNELTDSEKPKLQAVRLHEPVEAAALFDFGLMPRHLKNSGEIISARDIQARSLSAASA
jgi:hypothetical protein